MDKKIITNNNSKQADENEKYKIEDKRVNMNED